ncbi:MAG: VOC family protein [Chloroflexia bacterium]|nr:VOC family protein [Chloroflexia bacterium]
MPKAFQSQITFFYYHDLQPAVDFYEQVMGLECVEDQGWAKIYRTGGNAFLGLVDGSRGFFQAQEKNAALLTLVVDDVEAWYSYLQAQGAHLLRELKYHEDIQVQGFFLQDPGGYVIEIQAFLKPELAEVFHPQ